MIPQCISRFSPLSIVAAISSLMLICVDQSSVKIIILGQNHHSSFTLNENNRLAFVGSAKNFRIVKNEYAKCELMDRMWKFRKTYGYAHPKLEFIQWCIF